jgi:hypothetical protein
MRFTASMPISVSCIDADDAIFVYRNPKVGISNVVDPIPHCVA